MALLESLSRAQSAVMAGNGMLVPLNVGNKADVTSGHLALFGKVSGITFLVPIRFGRSVEFTIFTTGGFRQPSLSLLGMLF